MACARLTRSSAAATACHWQLIVLTQALSTRYVLPLQTSSRFDTYLKPQLRRRQGT